ncbi:hypothetical protein [Bythopirellula polymerisocia]|uniref:hypothetical protein n=1 Tax=Bythopirellula polymerisocia TaxID=2528003 RepID=UPI0011B8318A|nr:hypothetical protein [Bythopirellula polymerisocia]
MSNDQDEEADISPLIIGDWALGILRAVAALTIGLEGVSLPVRRRKGQCGSSHEHAQLVTSAGD